MPKIPFVLRLQRVVVRFAEFVEDVARMAVHVVWASGVVSSGGALGDADEGSVCVVVCTDILAFLNGLVHGRDRLVVVRRDRAEALFVFGGVVCEDRVDLKFAAKNTQ